MMSFRKYKIKKYGTRLTRLLRPPNQKIWQVIEVQRLELKEYACMKYLTK